MKELLYKKSEAVAALNRVDGFHPMELARKIGEEGQEEQLYLDVKYRKLWFRLVNPAGKIISRIITFTENMAVVEARIYLDKCDQEDNYVANSFSQKFRSDDPKFGDKFLEMAETAAVGRALSDAGYGVQFADVGEENDPAQVDAGIPYQNPQMPDSGAMENAAMPDSGFQLPPVPWSFRRIFPFPESQSRLPFHSSCVSSVLLPEGTYPDSVMLPAASVRSLAA